MPIALKAEYAHERRIREHNQTYYRVAHWPIWVFVFFLAPGPLTFDLFAHGPSRRNALWMILVLLGTALAGLSGQLPGVEQRPYILRFCEDKPNPAYRRICYTFAWNALLNFTALNLTGLAVAVIARRWMMKEIYAYGYGTVFGIVTLLGLFGLLPRTGASTQSEGLERRYFYAAVWSVTLAQTLLLLAWKTFPRTHGADISELILFTSILVVTASASAFGMLPRTRPILPGEVLVAD